MHHVSLQMSRKVGFEGNLLYGFMKKGVFRVSKVVYDEYALGQAGE